MLAVVDIALTAIDVCPLSDTEWTLRFPDIEHNGVSWLLFVAQCTYDAIKLLSLHHSFPC